MIAINIANEKLKDYRFLKDMYKDDYFPDFLVDKGKMILMRMCQQIETLDPKEDEEFVALAHKATDKFNDLVEDFEDNDSEIETTARESICMDFEYIAKAFGFGHIDAEELTAPRDW